MAVPILSSIFGTKPQIADYTSLDYSKEQLDALMGDLAAFPQISQLGADFQESYLSELNTAIPGFSDILAQGGALTSQMESVAGTELAGQIPADVAAQVQRTSAFQNLQSGASGPMAEANVARNYGLTSLDLINQGANLANEAGNAAQRWAGVSGAGQAASVMAGAIVTPQQRAAFDMQQNLIKQAVQQAKFNVAAAPDPIAKGLSDIVENLTAAYLGGKVGSIGAGNASAEQATANAFGPQMESAFAGTDAFGNPIGAGGGGGGAGGSGPGTTMTVPASAYDFGGFNIGSVNPASPGGYANPGDAFSMVGPGQVNYPASAYDFSGFNAGAGVDPNAITNLLNPTYGVNAFNASSTSPWNTFGTNTFGTPNTTPYNFGG